MGDGESLPQLRRLWKDRGTSKELMAATNDFRFSVLINLSTMFH